MRLSDLIEGYRGKDADIVGLASDSRAVKEGYLFAALSGEVVDGAKYIDQAVSAGAGAILTHHQFEGGGDVCVPLFQVEDPRLELAEIAAKFYAPQPKDLYAVTGTNGKTSVASFVRQIWEQLGIAGASLGTVGVVSSLGEVKLVHTTPDPITLHQHMQDLAKAEINHVIVEASSHGLSQRRLDGLRFIAAGFTNITRDHLDYHESFEAYFKEKQRLFVDLLEPGGVAVIDADAPGAGEVVLLCETHGVDVMTIGEMGRFLKVKSIEIDGFSQKISLCHHRGTSEICLPLVGDFQVSNVLVATGLVASGGIPLLDVLETLPHLKGAKGRLEYVGEKKAVGFGIRAPIFIDYAHTPDALETALKALEPYKNGRLVVIFGCGGDRDKGKRPMMGRIAQEFADVVIVTDDNPRSEDPSIIRSEILNAVPDALEIGDRGTAIERAVALLEAGDVLLVAGKGHETGQIIGNEELPFSDHEAVMEALKGAEAS